MDQGKVLEVGEGGEEFGGESRTVVTSGIICKIKVGISSTFYRQKASALHFEVDLIITNHNGLGI